MKNNMLRKLITLGLSFCMPLNLPMGVVAFENNNPELIPSFQYKPGITYFFKDCDSTGYYISGVESEKLNENDFSFEFLSETQIWGKASSHVRIYNLHCSIKIVLAVAALYVLDFDMPEIVNFLVNIEEHSDMQNFCYKVSGELVKKLHHRKVNTAYEMFRTILKKS